VLQAVLMVVVLMNIWVEDYELQLHMTVVALRA
jgi:hypothetical protein